MRITEMEHREAFSDILIETLKNGWIKHLALSIELFAPQESHGDFWFMHPLLNACCRARPSWKVKQFLRDSFCFTPITWRVPFQWALGTALVSRFGLQLTASPVFRTLGAVPNSSDLLIVPGNQRIRVFNFSSGICNIYLKSGFATETMRRDIEIRGRGPSGPFVRINDWADDYTWFEEPIIDGYPLPRCPPWYPRVEYEQIAFRVLSTWLEQTTIEVSVIERVNPLLSSIQNHCMAIRNRFPDFNSDRIIQWADILAEQSLSLGMVEVADTHGDFQPGNIIVGKRDRSVYIIDWEHCGQRFRPYDVLVYYLKSRSPKGLAGRLQRVLLEDNTLLMDFCIAGSSQKEVLAMFLLEDVAWFLAENTTGPYLAITEGLVLYQNELQLFGNNLEGLFF